MEKDPLKRMVDTAPSASAYDRDLLLALSRAAKVVQRARTAEDFYRAVGREIKSIGGNVTLLTINEDRRSLSIAYTSHATTLIRRAERLAGLSAREYPIPLRKNGYYRWALSEGRAVFLDSTDVVVTESLPRFAQALTESLVSLLKLQQGILAPLRLENETLGLMTVSGPALTAEHLPAMESFAGQIAAGLFNVRLMQKLTEELAARRRAEETLQHNRDLLLALSQAAQAVQKMNDQEGIYRVVGEQIKALGFEATILMLDEEKNHLYLEYTTLAERIIRAAEKISGLTAQGYRWTISFDNAYRRIIDSGKAEYISEAGTLFMEALPAQVRPMTGQLMRMLGTEKGVIAPLHVDEGTFGLLVVFGNQLLSEEDLPAVDSFAGQVAISLRNLRLSQQVTAELVERKQAEEAVRRVEAHFRSLIEKAPDGIVLIGPDGKNKYASPAARTILGFDPEDNIQENPLEYIHPEDVPAVLQAMSDLIQDPHAVPVLRYRYKHKDNFWRWLESTFSNLLAEPSVEAVVINFRDITAQRNMENLLNESERQHRALIENSTDGILIVNNEGRIRYQSPSVAHLLGYSPASLIGVNAFDLVHPDELADMASVFMQGLETPGYVHRGEYRLRHANGEWCYFEIISHYRMDDPAIAGIIINGRDITARKQAEDALRESEQKFHSVISESTDGVILLDEDGRIIEFNRALEEITGLRREDALQQYLWDMLKRVTPKSSQLKRGFDQVQAGIQLALKTGEAPFLHQIMEDVIERADGSICHVQHRLFAMATNKGWRLGGISRDITERKQAEEALRESKDRYRVLYEDNPSMYFTADSKGMILSINRFCVEQLGYAETELVGRPIYDIFLPEDRAAALQQFTACLENPRKTIQVEARKVRKNGEVLWVRETASAVQDSQGETVVLINCIDITKRKHAEQALADSESELRALFASMRDTVLVIDRDGFYRRIAPTHPGEFYILPETVVGKHLRDLFPAAQVDRFMALIQQVMETGQTQQIEYEIEINEQQCPWFEASVSPMGEDCTLWVARDITDRRHAQAALARSEQAYRSLFENMPIGLYRTSLDGRILDANPALVRMFGYPDRDSLLAVRAVDLYMDPAYEERFQREIQTQGVLSGFEAEFRRYGRSAFWAEDYVRLIYDEEGKPLYYEGSLVDITERRRAEGKLRRANAALEKAHAELKEMFTHEQVLARTDGLTGLVNRRHFFELATREFNASLRYERPLAIILFDVDGFKQVNDTFGHAMGDAILVQIAQVASQQIRNVDMLARYGGDEFIILLPETTAQKAFQIAERTREHVAVTAAGMENSPFSVTLSLGVAEVSLSPQDTSVEDAIRRADQALYAAKANGNNCTVIHARH